MKIKSVQIDPRKVKAGPDDGLAEGEFLVYPSTFIRKPDSYGDVVAKGAFVDDIKRWRESGNTLPGLYGHRMDDPDFFVASAHEMGEDEHGWWVRGSFDLDNPKAMQTYRLVKGRRLNQLSFAYDVVEEARVELADGQKVNELRKLRVHEFSFVPVGANSDTSVVAIKALADDLARRATPDAAAALRELRDATDSALAAIGEAGKAAPAADEDQSEASGTPEAKSDASDEEREAKSSVSVEEPKASPSVRLAAKTNNYAALFRSAEEGA